MRNISIIIPVWNEEKNIAPLVQRIHSTLRAEKIIYEIIFIDDSSTDKTLKKIASLRKTYRISVHKKQGKHGKAQSLIEGFSHAKYATLAMMDGDLQYPPEALPGMISKLSEEVDVVVANRLVQHTSPIRKIMSKSFKTLFGKFLFNLDYDIQAGLKVFKKEVYEYLKYHPTSGWTFDLEFLHKAKQAGFLIANYDIIFDKRAMGESKVSFMKTSFEIGFNAVSLKAKGTQPIHFRSLDAKSMRGAGVGYKQRKYVTHTTLNHTQSAIQTFTQNQRFTIAGIIAMVVIALFINPFLTVQVVIAGLSSIYFIDVIFNFFLVMKSLNYPQEITSTNEEIAQLDDSKLPVYSILCPLYKEAHVIPQFVEAISKLDWPKDKLDVLLLLEEDDRESIEAVKKLDLPKYIRSTIVPHSLPKTKPKACNYGLSMAIGQYLVIYDAEDMPDSLQLKKAFLGFQKTDEKVICLQAKLNYYNPHQNLLTRFFTAEYSLWFDVTLTGLQAAQTSIPLGGTSNHFRTDDLRNMEGWDPFNVTEDADLGIRLFKNGYKTAIIDSVTLEEANSNVFNWIRQRSRWIKGYMQTYLVHTRKHFGAHKNLWHTLLFHLNIGGKIAFILINPILWIATIAYFTMYSIVGPTIESLYPPLVFYLAGISLVFGNFMFIYLYMIGCAKRQNWSLIKYVYFIPLYWILISWSGFIALYQLLLKPHYWEKTLHGLHLKKKTAKRFIGDFLIGSEEVGFAFPNAFRQRLSKLIESRKKYVTGSGLIAATVVANVLNLVFNLYLGRNLNLEDFAIISLIGGFSYIARLPVVGLSTSLNFKVGFLEGKFGEKSGYQFWRIIRRNAVIISVVLTLLWVILSPFLTLYFHTNSILPFILFSSIWIVVFPSAVDLGFMGGRLLFGTLAVLTILEPFLKLLIAIVFIKIGLPHLAYFSIPISIVIPFILGWLLIIKNAPEKIISLTKENTKFPIKYFFATTISSLSSVTFLSLDIILAKHFLSPIDAGRYSLISLIGKMIYFSGSLAGQFLVPLISKQHGENKNTKKTFYSVLFSVFFLTFSAYLFCGAFGFITLPIIFGSKVHSILLYLPLFGFAMMGFTLARVFEGYYLIHKVYSFTVFFFLLAISQILIITINHNGVGSIVFAMTAVGVANLVIALLLYFFIGYVRPIENNIADFFGLFLKHKPSTQSNGYRNILIFNWRDTKHKWAGGAEIYIFELAKRWAKKGHQITIFCGNDGVHPRNEMIDGVRIVRRGGFYTVYIWAFLYYILRFRGHFDVIIDSENGIPFFTPLFSRKPIMLLIHHVHQDVFINHLSFPLSKIAQVLESKVMPLLYKHVPVVTVSESSKNEILKLGLGKNNNISIINPGIELEKYATSAKTRFPSLLYLGRLKPYKNIDIAIMAFAQLLKRFPKAQLTIAGYGESLETLEKLVEKLQIQSAVSFVGQVSEKQKISLLSKSWIFIQPSMIEGWGITVIEANASGTTVVASNVNGLKDSIVHEKTGLLVELKNVEEFEKAIELIISNRTLRTSLEKEAYIWSNNFSWDTSAEEFYKRIEKMFETEIVPIESGEVVTVQA